jgi:glycosyltransferase involved in cell wall biosynthesis
MRLVAYSDSTGVGGAEIVLGHLLAALGPDVEATVLAVDGDVAEAVAARRPGTGIVVAGSLAAHVRALRRLRPDLLHANHTWPWACRRGERAAWIAGVPVVTVDHLPVPSAVPRHVRLARRALSRHAAARVAVGERVARQIESLVGLPTGSVRAVANGVPAPVGPPPARSAGGPPVVGFAGRLTAQKGLPSLVRAVAGIEGARLRLVGDGPERGALEALAAALGAADRVEVTGWVAAAREAVAELDVLALASVDEGMPLTVLEAMHAGVPVVATDVGSVAEAVRDGVTGFVVPPGDEGALRERIAALTADPGLRARFGAAGRALAAERFTDVVMAERYRAIYDELRSARSAASR